MCAATEAGYIQYPSLPDSSIKTGCQLSPLQTSSYCYHHAPRVSKRCSTSDTGEEIQESQEDIVHVIVGKKTTRNTTYYKVNMIDQVYISHKVCFNLASTRING